MRIGSAFPSKYLRAADIPDGKFIPVTMDHVAIENVAGNDDPNDEKPVLYFVGKSKGMVLNKTNSTTISQAYGDETDEWAGKQISLYAAETTFQGKTMPCLRVKVVRGQMAAATPTPARQPQPQPVGGGGGRAPQEPPYTGEDEFGTGDDVPFRSMQPMRWI